MTTQRCFQHLTTALMHTPYRFFLVACTLLLVACGNNAASQPSPTASMPPPAQPAINTAQLQEQLLADTIRDATVHYDPNTPDTLTIDYQFDDARVANTQLDLGSAIYIETERTIEIMTKRVVALVGPETPITWVVVNRSMGDSPGTSMRIAISDMRAWSAGQMTADEYRARRYGESSDSYPDPKNGGASTYPAPDDLPVDAYPSPTP